MTCFSMMFKLWTAMQEDVLDGPPFLCGVLTVLKQRHASHLHQCVHVHL